MWATLELSHSLVTGQLLESEMAEVALVHKSVLVKLEVVWLV
jgi:hypothetical protein